MARQPRTLPAGFPAHVIQRGNNRQACFVSNQDKKALARWLAEGAREFGVEIHSWVFMTNHLHLLVTPKEDDSVSRCMQYLGRQYVPYFNHRLDRTGTLFEGRFKAHLVQSGVYFLQCARYIELNPVRAGMVSDPAHYSWSSYAAHAFGVNMALWTPHQEYLALGKTASSRQSEYRNLIRQELSTGVVDDIRRSASTGFVFGSESFRSRIEKLTGIPQRYRKRGRPATDARL